MELIKGNCLEKLKDIPDQSVDLAYMDLCYGQTACKWDKKFTKDEWVIFWKELKRVARNDRTPFFFSCTTKFGFDIIESNKKWFRWDLVWKKNRAAGFLNAYKLPMRKHEMIYCFSDKCPEYDISSHKEGGLEVNNKYTNHKDRINNHYGLNEIKINEGKTTKKKYKIPLPTSDITPPTEEHELVYCFSDKCPDYDVSSHSEYKEEKLPKRICNDIYGKVPNTNRKRHTNKLPNSDITPPTEEHELVYCFAKKCPEYDVSSHNEYIEQATKKEHKSECYNIKNNKVTVKVHKTPLPNSDITPHRECNTTGKSEHYGKNKTGKRNLGKNKQPLLPTSDITPIDIDKEEPSSWCEFKNNKRTGHRTAKPVALMEFLLKYWCKEGGTVLDPTMGSGSMGIACKKMNRKFIGIELNDDIYELAKKRIGV